MAPTPTASGLVLSDLIIVERGTAKVSIIGEFNRLILQSPQHVSTFHCFAILSDSIGELESELIITRLDSDEDIYHSVRILAFPNRLSQVKYVEKIMDCQFETGGRYQATLLADGVWIAERSFDVIIREELRNG